MNAHTIRSVSKEIHERTDEDDRGERRIGHEPSGRYRHDKSVNEMFLSIYKNETTRIARYKTISYDAETIPQHTNTKD